MKIVSKLVERIETKTEHDLVKAIVGLIAGFAVAKFVENVYDSALKTSDDDSSTTN